MAIKLESKKEEAMDTKLEIPDSQVIQLEASTVLLWHCSRSSTISLINYKNTSKQQHKEQSHQNHSGVNSTTRTSSSLRRSFGGCTPFATSHTSSPRT